MGTVSGRALQRSARADGTVFGMSCLGMAAFLLALKERAESALVKKDPVHHVVQDRLFKQKDWVETRG